MIVTCDRCNSEFEIVLQNKKFGTNVATYFCCPVCNKAYNLFYANTTCEALQKQIKHHLKLLKASKTREQYVKELNIIHKKQNQLKRQQILLEKQYRVFEREERSNHGK